MNGETSACMEPGEVNNSLKASLAELNEAYSNDRLDSYKALGLKDSYAEKTSCNVQWGPMMRA